LFISYGYQGNVKEVAIAGVIAAGVLIADTVRTSLGPAWGVALGVLIGDAVTVYSTAAGPYLIVLVVVALAAAGLALRARVARIRVVLVSAALATACAFAVAGPQLSGLVTFQKVASGTFASATTA